MKKLIMIFVGIIFGISLLPLIINMSDDYDLVTTAYEFTAVSDTTVHEIFDLVDNNLIPLNITSVTVNGSEIVVDEYNYSDSQTLVQLDATSSDIGDLVVIYNTVEIEIDDTLDTLIQLIPTIFIIIIVSAVVVILYKKN